MSHYTALVNGKLTAWSTYKGCLGFIALMGGYGSVARFKEYGICKFTTVHTERLGYTLQEGGTYEIKEVLK